eukprot:TRINITY_DN37156_c0_g1_i1.p1 TRINITY_DN37156_c0_g1~~TRINITY_DN37156_c0_g1_i1.p1  ORF type:complete len:748 (+),score=152.08 TRINITY_DN37156_c0_g1_i1:36-2279(+)
MGKMEEKANELREMVLDLQRTEEAILRKRRKLEQEDFGEWGNNNIAAIDDECAEKYGLLMELARDQIMSPTRYKYATESFDGKTFGEVDPTDIASTLLYRLLRGETERVPGSRKKHRQDFIDLTTTGKKKVREALTILISRYLTAQRAAELQSLLLNNTKSMGVIYNDETLSGHILEYLDHYGGSCESQYYTGAPPTQDCPPPVVFPRSLPEVEDPNEFVVETAKMFPPTNNDKVVSNTSGDDNDNDDDGVDFETMKRYFTPSDPYEERKIKEIKDQNQTLGMLKPMTGLVEDIIQCEWIALNASVPESVAELLNEDFCDALSEGAGIPPEGSVQGDVTKLNVYEILISKERENCKDRLCSHSLIPILLKYAAGVARDVAALSSPGVVERSALRCLTEALRILSSPNECNCKIPSSLMYSIIHEVGMLYLRLNAPKYAIIFLWELSTHEACGGRLTNHQLVNLNIYLFQLLLDVLPRTSFDLPPNGMLLALHLPPPGKLHLGENGKRVLTMWEYQLTMCAGSDPTLKRYCCHVIKSVKSHLLGESRISSPVKPPTVIHSEIESIISQCELTEEPYVPKGENTQKTLSDWLTEIAYVVVIEADYAKGDRLFHEAQELITDLGQKIILAANHCALLVCWGKCAIPALYHMYSPCRKLCEVGEFRSAPPSILTRLAVSVVRNSPTSLRYFLHPENAHLRSPEIRFLLFFERLRNRSVPRTEIVAQIAKAFPTALSSSCCVAMTPVTAAPT